MKKEKISKLFKRFVLGAGLNALTLAGSLHNQNAYSSANLEKNHSVNFSNLEEAVLTKEEKEKKFNEKVIEYNSSKIKLPYYHNIPPGFCSQYAKTVAKNLFNKEYVWEKNKPNSGAAWNLRYSNEVVEKLDSLGEIKELIINDVLKPGMLVGIYNPKSRHNNKKDLKGNKVDYTHVMLYVGIDKKGEPEFFHQIGSKIERINLSKIRDFEQKGWKVIEVIDAKQDYK